MSETTVDLAVRDEVMDLDHLYDRYLDYQEDVREEDAALAALTEEEFGPVLPPFNGRSHTPPGTEEYPFVVQVTGTPDLRRRPDGEDELHSGQGSVTVIGGEVALLQWPGDGQYAIIGADNAVAVRALSRQF